MCNSAKLPADIQTSVTKSKLALLITLQASEYKRQGVEARKTTLLGKPAD